MWYTSAHPLHASVLKGAARDLFMRAICELLSEGVERDFAEYEPAPCLSPFQALSIPDKYLVLRAVTRALLSPESPPPFLSALFESAVYAVYETLIRRWEDSHPDVAIDGVLAWHLEDARRGQDVIYFNTVVVPLSRSGGGGGSGGGVGDADAVYKVAPAAADVRAALVKEHALVGAAGLVSEIMNCTLWDSDFLLDPKPPLECLRLKIEPAYWTAGAAQLAALRDEARGDCASFGVVFCDIKSAVVPTGLPRLWRTFHRDVAIALERAAPTALTHPVTRAEVTAAAQHVAALHDDAYAVFCRAAKRARHEGSGAGAGCGAGSSESRGAGASSAWRCGRRARLASAGAGARRSNTRTDSALAGPCLPV